MPRPKAVGSDFTPWAPTHLEVFRRVDGLLVARILIADQKGKRDRVIDLRFAVPLVAPHSRGTLFLTKVYLA